MSIASAPASVRNSAEDLQHVPLDRPLFVGQPAERLLDLCPHLGQRLGDYGRVASHGPDLLDDEFETPALKGALAAQAVMDLAQGPTALVLTGENLTALYGLPVAVTLAEGGGLRAYATR